MCARISLQTGFFYGEVEEFFLFSHGDIVGRYVCMCSNVMYGRDKYDAVIQ